MADTYDVSQLNIYSVFKYSIAATVLTVNTQRGPGTLTRTGVGTLRITYASGKGLDNTRCAILFMGSGTVMIGGTWDEAASTDEVKDLRIFDNAGMALDNVNGTIIVAKIL